MPKNFITKVYPKTQQELVFIAKVNNSKSSKTIHIGYKKWCVYLQRSKSVIFLQSFGHNDVCVKKGLLPHGEIGTVAMLKAALFLAKHIWKDKITTLELCDESGFDDKVTRTSISLSMRNLCIYGQTWYQQHLGSTLHPLSTFYQDEVQKIIKTLNKKANNLELLNLFSTSIISNNLTYQQNFLEYYKIHGNKVYSDLIIPFIQFFKLANLEGIPWTMSVNDINLNLPIKVKPYDKDIQFGYGPTKIQEKVKGANKTLERIAHELLFIDDADYNAYLEYQVKQGHLNSKTVLQFKSG